MKLSLTTPAAVEIVTLDEAKKHARIFKSTDDSYITELIKGAREQFERETGLWFASSAWKWEDVAAAESIVLPIRRISRNATITVTDGNSVTVDPGDYSLVVEPTFGQGRLDFTTVPTGPLVIDFTAGYAAADAPASAKFAIKSLVAHWYVFREAYVASQNGDLRNVPGGYSSIRETYR